MRLIPVSCRGHYPRGRARFQFGRRIDIDRENRSERRMQIDLIETFLDLCETRSFNRTADRLGVTQSTVSGRIGTLERALERRLFTRGRAGTELTTEGLMFAPHARALRLGWAEALHAARQAGDSALTLRIGIQNDLAAKHIGDWVGAFRAAFPGVSFYVEPDYSASMCAEVAGGSLDLAMLYTPKPLPDLHFETVGEIAYCMVSTETDRLAGVRPDSYILPNFSPAFAQTHAILHPGLATAQVSSGQDAAVAGLLLALGGTTYVLEETARTLAASGQAQEVRDAAPITQTVFAAVHLRNRHRTTHRRLVRLLRSSFEPARRR
jgi:LysR family transcriptional regulator, flagellar master operon regulator